jgi:glycosyltransferase involved in cell wall biosynthesis
MKQVGILHIDIEGGFGGSSRSLFELVSRLDPKKVRPVIVHKLQGPLEEWYSEKNIASVHLPHIAQFVPRKRNSWKIFLIKFPEYLSLFRTYRALRSLIKANDISVVHLNYEGLWLIAPFLRRDRKLHLIVHCRTLLPKNMWTRFIVRVLEKHVDHVFFISPNEKEAFLRYARGEVPHSVLWNIARPVFPLPPEERSSSRRIVVLSNIDYLKGIDRCLDLAEALIRADQECFTIEIYGMARSAPAYFQQLKEDIKKRSLCHMVKLMGFTKNPEDVLKSAFCLVRPSRDADPWGRDVIEAVSAGIPVLATGTFEGVVLHQRTGFLFDPFDAAAMAQTIRDLAADKNRYLRISRAGMALGRMRFSGHEQASEFQTVVDRLTAQEASVEQGI